MTDKAACLRKKKRRDVNRNRENKEMYKSASALQWSLRAGALYFTAIALAHTFGVKIPGLFIYFNVPSHPYQDHIIAFLAFGWAILYYIASVDPLQNLTAVKGVLLASLIAIAGLERINFLDRLPEMGSNIDVLYHWQQTFLLMAYVVLLFVLYTKSRNVQEVVE